MAPLDAIKVTFFEECAELMESLEEGLLVLQSGAQDADTVDSVFRAVHSIKGGAAAFDLGVLVAFAHEFETALEALRSGRLQAESEVISIFLRSCDVLGDLVAAARADEQAPLPDTSDLARLLETSQSTGDQDDGTDFKPVMLDFGLEAFDEDVGSQDAPTNSPARIESEVAEGLPHQEVDRQRRIWSILFEPLPDLLISGNEPLFLFRALEVMGRLNVRACDDDLPTLHQLEPHVPRLRWSIDLDPSAPDLTETEIENVFEFAVDLCVLEIEHSLSKSAVSAAPYEPALHNASILTSENANPKRPESMVSEAGKGTSSKALADAENTDNRAAIPIGSTPVAAPVSTTIRVDLERVDRLVNLVGELVITQSMLAQGMTRAGLDQHSEAVSTLDELQQLTRDMQDSVMSIRAQPVKSLFQRMTRIVREAAQATGKQVCLVTEGEGTEIDKTVVERLADPLTHMIRNAIDHGLEAAADEREKKGKDPIGQVRLTARQQSDRVVIEVSDDGRGIDRIKVLKRATERGLVPEGKVLETAEIDRLLFMPGFSTNDQVSALSGRGVGMDVVQRAIRDLNGTISIVSQPGQGCSISISLPLTLAILDGMIVRSNQQRMVIPLSAILETQTLSAARLDMVGANHRIVQLHDRFVPLISLAESMGFPSRGTFEDEEDAALLFIEADDIGPFALCVDAIEAQRQVVIKGLSENFGNVSCVSAATILGDGHVALIVDPIGIAARSGLQHRHSTSEKGMRAS